jgi:hypothetical protein
VLVRFLSGYLDITELYGEVQRMLPCRVDVSGHCSEARWSVYLRAKEWHEVGTLRDVTCTRRLANPGFSPLGLG